MPETSVNEDNQALAAERKIRATWQWLVPTPAGDSGATKHGRECQLGGFVAFRSDGGHHLRTFFLGEDVGHAGEFTRILAFGARKLTSGRRIS